MAQREACDAADDDADIDTDVHFYTDGACRGNPGPGGWGVVCKRYVSARARPPPPKKRDEPSATNTAGYITQEWSGYEPATTNNRMELLAAIKALESLGGMVGRDWARTAHLITDSRYVKDGITKWIARWKANGWRTKGNNKQPVKNQDLWQRLDKLCAAHTIEWHWVKGHSGHPENERTDRLATRAIKNSL